MTSTSRSPAPRRPLIEKLRLALPYLPPPLHGLRLCHLTDLHVRKPRRRHRQLLDELARLEPCDLLLLTGDYMCKPGDESPALDLLRRICDTLKPMRATLGVFGNHDSHKLRRFAADLPVHWLTADHPWRTEHVTVLGVDCAHGNYHGDLLAALLGEHQSLSPTEGLGQGPAVHRPLRLLLSHMPSWLPTAADAGIDLVLSGHTHGGQCRLPGARVLHNGYGDWPARLSSGILRMRSTHAVVARGLGETKLDNLRLFCPPQALLMTLTSDGEPPAAVARLDCLRRW